MVGLSLPSQVITNLGLEFHPFSFYFMVLCSIYRISANLMFLPKRNRWELLVLCVKDPTIVAQVAVEAQV